MSMAEEEAAKRTRARRHDPLPILLMSASPGARTAAAVTSHATTTQTTVTADRSGLSESVRGGAKGEWTSGMEGLEEQRWCGGLSRVSVCLCVCAPCLSPGLPAVCTVWARFRSQSATLYTPHRPTHGPPLATPTRSLSPSAHSSRTLPSHSYSPLPNHPLLHPLLHPAWTHPTAP